MSDYDDGSGYAPNRGPTPPQRGLPANQQDTYSVGSLISGILAVLLGLFCGLLSVPIGILAIVLGVRGRQRCTELGKGSGLAIAGIALGGLAIVLTVAFLAVRMVLGNGQS